MLSGPAPPPARFGAILEASPVTPGEGAPLGRSREGRAVRGFRLGSGPTAVSLLGGCHADEPVGPRFLRRLVGYLSGLPADDPWLERHEWWIVPHINPDGELRNAPWADEGAAAYELGRYLRNVVREPPGDDIEFGFPRDSSDEGARPENRAVYAWWRGADRPFVLHASLHGMGFAAGPWFLLEPAWRGRLEGLKRRCAGRVEALGYILHDVEREGEKGFVRLGRGFTTRPDSRAMRAHFEGLGDPETARLFRPSSMETVRRLADD
ncbi:MAG: M14 family zinc carboxypeptidase, partial [Gemmatimonadota bacterium]|nr:M14 family zinc carboxypeptidase [Gemmatimonadota bacterium]